MTTHTLTDLDRAFDTWFTQLTDHDLVEIAHTTDTPHISTVESYRHRHGFLVYRIDYDLSDIAALYRELKAKFNADPEYFAADYGLDI